jgi:DNA-damage-inducible protein J
MANIHVRVKDETKKSASKVLERMGIDMTTAITMYLHQIVITQTIPFRLVTENGLTIQQEREILKASEEAKRGINVEGPFETEEEIQAYLDSLK